MKAKNKLLGILSAVIFFIGIIFKGLHYPGATILMLFGVISGLLFMLSFFIFDLQKATKGIEKVTLIFGVFSGITVLLGLIFKTLHWPAANILISVSHAALFLFTCIAFYDAYLEPDSGKSSIKALFAYLVFILMSILLFFFIRMHKFL